MGFQFVNSILLQTFAQYNPIISYLYMAEGMVLTSGR